jgi:predicted DNA-binding ribbon-helix-helix protein
MTLDELLKRISEDRSSESETTSVLREHLGRDGYVDQNLRTALISADTPLAAEDAVIGVVLIDNVAESGGTHLEGHHVS